MTRQSDGLLDRLLRFSQSHAVAVLVVAGVLTAVMGYFAARIQVVPDWASFIPEDERNNRLIEKYGGGAVKTEYLVVAAEREDPFEPAALRAFHDMIETIGEAGNIQHIVHPFNQFHFAKIDSRLAVMPITPDGAVPTTPAGIEQFRERLLNDIFARSSVISPDGRILVAFFPSDSEADQSRFIELVYGAVEELEQHFSVYVSGIMVFEHVAREYLLRDFPKFLILAVAFILVMYYLGFRSLRAVVLPLIVVCMGTIWTLGFMSIAGFALSMASIVTPPLILTLGSSYSIHILNQYYRDGGTDPAASVGRVSKTIRMASITTLIGFMGLLATSLAQTRQFGIASGVGIMLSAFLSLGVFPAALSLLKPPPERKRARVLEGLLARSMRRIARFAVRYRVWMCVALVASIGLAAVTYGMIRHQADYIRYFPQDTRAVEDTFTINRRVGSFQQLFLTLTAPAMSPNFFLHPAVLRDLAEVEDRIAAQPEVVSVLSFATYVRELAGIMTGTAEVPKGRPLIDLVSRYFRVFMRSSAGNTFINPVNEDFSRFTYVVRVCERDSKNYIYADDLQAFVDRLEAMAEPLEAQGITAEVWGPSLRYISLAQIVDRDQRRSSLASVALILILTAIVFRSLKHGLLALLPLVVGLALNFAAMALLIIPMDMTTAMVFCVAIGIGVDHAIHFLIQYRLQREQGDGDIDKIIERTLVITGRPIVLTSVSIVAGLCVLLFATFRPIVFFGFLVALALSTTTVATLFVLPAVVSLLDYRKRRPRSPARETSG